eukprot:scaffold167606_cov36-Tisochrysis_lutea.AAC.2
MSVTQPHRQYDLLVAECPWAGAKLMRLVLRFLPARGGSGVVHRSPEPIECNMPLMANAHDC